MSYTPNDGTTQITGPIGAFGELVVEELHPRVQIDAVYGIHGTDAQTFTNGTGASAGASSGLFEVDCGTDVGGYGTVRSERLARYRPGQGIRARFTAMFSGGEANYLSGAGMFTSTDALWVGYSGATFGLMRRIPGTAEIRTLTITGGATGSGTIGVELNGVTTNVSIGGALSAAATAETIAQETFTGWTVSATGAVVTFLSQSVAVLAGAFSFSAGTSGATATGPTQVQAGTANDIATGFVAQTSWNIDVCDGTGPSGINLDPSKLNVWQIVLPYLGAGAITFSVMDPVTGRFQPVHRIPYPNANTTPNAGNPTYRIGWFSASLGSTTSYTVKGASGAIFVEGERRAFRDPAAYARTATSVSSEVALVSIRDNSVFSSVTNQREVDPHTITAGVEGSKPAVIRVYKNATLSGVPAWTSQGSDSCVDYEGTNGLTVSGGLLVAAVAIQGGSSAEIELHELDLRLQPGDTLTVTGEISGGAGNNITAAVTWQEH